LVDERFNDTRAEAGRCGVAILAGTPDAIIGH
jgi:hypothetical protein